LTVEGGSAERAAGPGRSSLGARRRERMLRAGLLLLGLIAGAVFSEGAVRLLARRLFSLDSLSHRFDPELGWVQQQGVTMRRRNEAGTALAVEGGALGIRRPPAAYRTDAASVLVVGDSFTAGTQVPFQDTWTWRLQERLRAQGLDVQLVNAGVDGYDLSQSYRLARRLWSTFRPRQLILALFVGNDIVDYERVSAARPPWDPTSPRTWLREHSYLYRLLAAKLGPAHAPSDQAEEPLPDVGRSVRGFDELRPRQRRSVQRQFAAAELLPVLQGNEEGRRRLLASERLIGATRDLARGRSAGFTLILIPTKQQVVPAQRAEWMALHRLDLEQALAPQRALRRWAEANGVAVVDPLDVMAQAPDPQSLYWTANMHLTPEGHEALARAALPLIERQLRASLPVSAPAGAERR
jgi:lysophospholipase L1-like esterase